MSESKDLGLPPDEELFRIFGGVNVAMCRPAEVNILSVYSSEERGHLIVYSSAKSGELALRRWVETATSKVFLKGHFSGYVVAPPEAVQLATARERAPELAPAGLRRCRRPPPRRLTEDLHGEA